MIYSFHFYFNLVKLARWDWKQCQSVSFQCRVFTFPKLQSDLHLFLNAVFWDRGQSAYLSLSQTRLLFPNSELLLVTELLEIDRNRTFFKTRMITTSLSHQPSGFALFLQKTHDLVPSILALYMNPFNTVTFSLLCRLTWPPFLSLYGRHTHCC